MSCNILNPAKSTKISFHVTTDCFENINLGSKERTHDHGWKDEAHVTLLYGIKMVLAWVLAKDSLILSAYPLYLEIPPVSSGECEACSISRSKQYNIIKGDSVWQHVLL